MAMSQDKLEAAEAALARAKAEGDQEDINVAQNRVDGLRNAMALAGKAKTPKKKD